MRWNDLIGCKAKTGSEGKCGRKLEMKEGTLKKLRAMEAHYLRHLSPKQVQRKEVSPQRGADRKGVGQEVVPSQRRSPKTDPPQRASPKREGVERGIAQRGHVPRGHIQRVPPPQRVPPLPPQRDNVNGVNGRHRVASDSSSRKRRMEQPLNDIQNKNVKKRRVHASAATNHRDFKKLSIH